MPGSPGRTVPRQGCRLTRTALTAAAVAQTLKSMGWQVQTGIGQSGVVGLLEGPAEGPCVLARFDMDALPVTEQTGAPYASVIEGAMHACGHDGHTAIGLGVAALLSQAREELPGTIKLVFQPGEEGFDGALGMIEDGVLENPVPDACLALHLWNTEPVGWFGLTAGPVMAGAEKVQVTVHGQGGHGSAPELAVDPVLAGSQIVVALQSIVSRSINPMEAAVVSITSMHAGTTFNVIPPDLVMEGTIRTFQPEVRRVVLERLQEVASSIARAMGCTADVEIRQVSLPVNNDLQLTELLQQAVPGLFPGATLDTNCRVMGSEDMAEFQARVPGVYMFVGSNNPSRGLTGAHHNPNFDFDEDALPLGTGLMTAAVISLLGRL